jgi:lysyl-tRNA synthetase, class II
MEDKLVEERLLKLREMKLAGIEPYPYSFNKTHDAKSILETHKALKPEDKTSDKVNVAGRVVGLRRMGKATFMHIQDESGKLQLYLRSEDMGQNYEQMKWLDMGDIIGAEGTIFATKTGEISVYVKSFQILTKSVRPLPEKFHGLKDPELRYRKRYLDLITNPEIKELFKTRTKIIGLVRNYLDTREFLEVQTPVLQNIYGGTNARPFTTQINAYNMNMYLRVAPELYLKRLVIGGFERVYEIAVNFRNEGVDQTHNPEFTMIEWYEAYVDYHAMMDRAEEMIKSICQELYGKPELKVHDKTLDIGHKWKRIQMKQAILEHLKIDVEKLDDNQLAMALKENGIAPQGSHGQMIFALFDKTVAPTLIAPTWIIDYPKEVSPLAKVHRKDPKLVERYELYIGGKEICDGWTELVSPEDQRNRFENEQKSLRAGNAEAHPLDEDWIEALEYGMPPTGGIGMGIDRLVMLFTNNWSIRDVMFFPIMKPKIE